jgi:hypothetical protein
VDLIGTMQPEEMKPAELVGPDLLEGPTPA